MRLPPEAPTITAYKGFGLDWKCRDFQYAPGQSYEHNGPVEACAGGFHACEYPLHVLRYYKPGSSLFATVEQSGSLARHDEDSKIASSRITIKAEISLTELIKASIKYTMDRCTPAKGANSDEPNKAVKAEGKNKSATASGYSGAATASGDSGAATASGDYGKARGAIGCALFLAERNSDRKIINVWAGIAGQGRIKPDTYYRLQGGKPTEVA